MKKIILIIFIISVLFIFNYAIADAQSDTLSGAALLDVIDTGLSANSRHFGMSYCDSALYLTSYADNLLTKIDLTTNSVAPGYPAFLVDTNLPHGVIVDEDDSSIWVCDLNSSMIRHYSPSLTLIESKLVGSQPVNAIIYQDTIYVADREEDKVFVINKSTLVIENSFAITDMNSSAAGGYTDLFIYSDKLYIVSDELEGIAKMNLDGTNQETIMVQGESDLAAFGIYIQNGRIYLNTSSKIITTDLQSNILNYWNIDRPAGFTGVYIDIKIIDNKIYVPSFVAGGGDTTCPHILVYQEKVATPTFDPAPGTFDSTLIVNLICEYPDTVIIYYTLDGTEPTDSSIVYADSIIVDSTMTIKALAYKTDLIPSDIAVGTYIIDSTGIYDEQLNTQLPNDFSISQNYPNPFNPSTSINYQLPINSKVTLKIYSINGELVKTLVDKEQTAGYYTIEWNGKDELDGICPSGIYLYRIETDKDYNIIKKAILLK